MPTKASIYIGEGLMAALSAVGDKAASNRSGRVTAIAERYMAIIEDAMPTFTLNEWAAIVDANNGCALSDIQTAPLTYSNVWDAADELSQKWNIDAKKLAGKMRALPLAGRLAVAEIIERYWGGAYRITDRRKSFEMAGARLREVEDRRFAVAARR